MTFEQALLEFFAGIGCLSSIFIVSLSLLIFALNNDDWTSKSESRVLLFLFSSLPALLLILSIESFISDDLKLIGVDRLEKLEAIEKKFEESGSAFYGVEVGGENFE